MADVLPELLAALTLERIDADIYRGTNTERQRPRVFGGLVAAQALVAACRTVQAIAPHSVHAYFLRPGRPGTPIVYDVHRIRDGRSFTTRRIVAKQEGEAIFNMAVSFHKLEDGLEHQEAMPDVPAPDSCPTWAELLASRAKAWPESARGFMTRPRPVEIRPIDPFDPDDAQPSKLTQRFWMRAGGEMPDDPLMHQAVLLYASDHSLISAMTRPHGRALGMGAGREFMAASLDHALWFHRPMRVDRWFLYDQRTPVAAHARGLALGHFFTEQGELCATAVQEGLIRPL